MTIEVTYLGTATTVLKVGRTRLLTDPVFDPVGAAFDFGLWCTPRSWFSSQKLYSTPEAAVGALDGVLLSHDHHGDNLDLAGRRLVAAAKGVVVTTPAGARRLARPAGVTDAPGGGLGLGERVRGIGPGQSVRIADVAITATVARHGPWFVPQVNEVTGFLLDVDDGPRVWISGDTVMTKGLAVALEEIAAERPVDVAVVHCGAVAFPHAPGLGRTRFTFDAVEAVAAARMCGAKAIVPVHRSGWAHFRQPEAALRAAFSRAGLEGRTRFLEMGETATF